MNLAQNKQIDLYERDVNSYLYLTMIYRKQHPEAGITYL